MDRAAKGAKGARSNSWARRFYISDLAPLCDPTVMRTLETTSRILGVWVGVAIVYLVVRFGFTQKLDALHPYASYVFEAVLVTLALCTGLVDVWRRFGRVKSLAFGGVLSLIGGGAVYRLASAKGIAIPFDLKSNEAILFLIVVAPILEEAVFRFFLWKPIELVTNRTLALFITTLLFSYSHFHAYWFYPAEIHPFIFYQSAYTLGLGLGAGYFVWRFNAIWGAILIHFMFNLGFYLAYALS